MVTENDRRVGQKRWGLAALAVSSALILLFLLYADPWIGERIPLFQPAAQHLEEHNIEANIYVYTEVEVFSDAQLNVMKTMTLMLRESGGYALPQAVKGCRPERERLYLL